MAHEAAKRNSNDSAPARAMVASNLFPCFQCNGQSVDVVLPQLKRPLGGSVFVPVVQR